MVQQRSCSRCHPPQRVCQPGWPSLLRPMKPPSLATARQNPNTVHSLASFFISSFRLSTSIICLSTTFTALSSGLSRLNSLNCNSLTATTARKPSKAVSPWALPNCLFSIEQPVFRHLWYSSINQRWLYHSTILLAAAASFTSSVVKSIHSTPFSEGSQQRMQYPSTLSTLSFSCAAFDEACALGRSSVTEAKLTLRCNSRFGRPSRPRTTTRFSAL